MGKILNIAIFYHYIAHYRLPVFKKMLLNREIRFHIYSDNKSNLTSIKTFEQELNEGWSRINNYWFGKNLLFQPAIIKNAFMGKEDVVIYLGNMWFISTWIAAIIARLSGKKILMWTHGVRKLERNLRGVCRLCFYRLADGLLLYGHRARRLLVESGYPEEKMYVIYNSLDYDRQKEIASTLTIQSRSVIRLSLFTWPELPILLVLGRMVDRVNYPFILKVVKKLHEMNFQVNLLIVGDGPLRGKVTDLVEKFNLEEFVHLYGSCYDEIVLGPLINAADITVGPGSIGLSCIHSLVYGTPVFSHDDPDGELGPEFEVVNDGVNGGVFEKGNEYDCAIKIKDWLEKHPDRKNVEEICRNSILPYYTPDYQVQEIVRVIKSVQ